ncbi:MAG: hydrogenase [Elusimicrobia bacterium CG_4_9_14_3_um_filter_62_55]|nr:MAG: hydrogenase [Elusimicrobia bacterium CG22_combo_CG10-13_8_21_14_all_63_91]PJA17922.1 MAG: hydrogenase [Elusimicrobia bacterium CG_4_10_14_0_2_um_filter_63_34]PJB25231.1 MAG: hydrogenase [Elusimicrobia bacterium CG_4_9_14_3_um_filter_62_55]
MEQLSQLLLAFIVFLSLYLLGSSSLTGCIKIVALQGMCLGVLPLTIHAEGFHPRALLLAAGMFVLKGIVIPRILKYAIREVKIRRELEPIVGYAPSLLLGAALVGVSFVLAERLPVPAGLRTSLLIPISLATVMMGMLMMISRIKAVTQVIGYLVFENGIYLFGLAISYEVPWLIEMGVLLDVFVAVFVMGIVIDHIARAFDSISTEKMTRLND